MAPASRLFLLILLLGLALPGRPAVAAAGQPPLDEVRDLAAAGATGLALRLVEEGQPAYGANPPGWLRWERERLAILSGGGAWGPLVARVRGYAGDLPADFRQEARLLGVRALLAQGEGAAARRWLRDMLWGDGPQAVAAAVLRRLVVESYLVDGTVEDAVTAMRRYRLDFGDRDDATRLLAARVMLLADQPEEALQLLEGVAPDEAPFLTLVARLRTGALDWAEGQAAVEALAGEDRLTAAEHHQLAAVLAERATTPAQRVSALERALAHRRLAGTETALATATPDALWAAYATYARILSNVHQLLIGQFEHWLALARELAPRDRAAARSLYAYVAEEAGDPVWRRAAQESLVAALGEVPGGLEVLRQLYLAGGRYAEPDAIPAPVRYGLVEQALARGDIPLASRLARDLAEPPPGGDDFQWPLRRGRVLVLGGQAEEGARVVAALVARHDTLADADVDRINQVVFDLQEVGEPGLAHDLFARLLTRVEDPRRRRELLYWMADARDAQGRPAEAARLYLRSALLPGAGTMDPWSRSARFKAAEALAAAGLAGDARRLYEDLLATTGDAERSAVLRRALRRLGPPQGGASGRGPATGRL